MRDGKESLQNQVVEKSLFSEKPPQIWRFILIQKTGV